MLFPVLSQAGQPVDAAHCEGQGGAWSLCLPCSSGGMQQAAVLGFSVRPVWTSGTGPWWLPGEAFGASMRPLWHWQVTKMACRVTVNREGM